ncbi:cupin domain-containing protein [Exilibacterium tricleocarpae]|uniref:Cupin domain-containing protein n=1 Tax=Exilibacterium tricleocarpae TaxID=2591008 RepID=A0A545SYY1_9GAMM|nr:cupin domain-containing protein [Exilibacterium tricleocarpae]TQV70139.1 cupin domain-containing protein [Exilibacterium tricleocarpae]
MRAEVKYCREADEYVTEERCAILEVANDAADPALSIARARVEPGVTTAWHKLSGVTERYLIVSGCGEVELGAAAPAAVGPGDVVRIPADTAQRITNTGAVDLVFYAICSPRFEQQCYIALE